MNRGTGHAAVINVANDRHLEAFKIFLVTEDGIGIEQCLGWMLMHAIAGIYHRNIQMLGHEQGSAGQRMAHHDDIRTHGPQRVGRIKQRLALLDAGSTGELQRGHRNHGFRRDFERAAGARGGFVKQKQHALSAQQGTRLERIHPPGKLEYSQDFSRIEMFDTQQRSTRRFVHGFDARWSRIYAILAVMDAASYAGQGWRGKEERTPDPLGFHEVSRRSARLYV